MKGTALIRIARLALLAASLSVFPARGQPVPLAFEESVALALAHNPALRNARANLVAAEHRARAAYSGFFPQVSGNISYADTTDGTSALVGDTSDYSTNLTITQNLFDGFQNQARVAQGTANADAAQAQLIAAKAQLSRDLKAAYAGLLYAQDNVVLSADILRRVEENLRLVELRFEGGRENKGAFLVSRAAVAQARFERLQAQQALTSAQTQLAAVTGQRATDLRASGGVPVMTPPRVTDFAGLAQQAPDVREAIARERAAAADVQLARSGFYPSVNVSGTAARGGDTWFPDNDRRSLNATISIPIFSGGRDYHGVRAAAAAEDAVEADRVNVEYQAVVRLTQSYAAYVEAAERLEVDREFLAATETRADIARARYQNGLIGFEDWDRAENDLIQRQRALLVSRRERVTAEAAWELAQGRGVIP